MVKKPKIDIKKVVADMQKLYDKDKKVKSMITTGASVKSAYTEKDVIVLSEHHPFRQLTGMLGQPYNKIIQCAGRPDSGKSTWAAELMVAAQKQDVLVILWDSEEKFDAHRFKGMGGDPDSVIMAKTNEILKGGELVRKYITSFKEQDPDVKILFVWDSAGGSQSRSHAERELDSEKHAQPGQDAKEIGSIMKMLVGLINKYPDSIAVYIANQTYAKIGFMQKGDATSGGAKLEYHSSFIVMLKRIKVLTSTVKGVVMKRGIIVRATVSKPHLSFGKTSIHQMDFEVTADGYKAAGEITEVEDDD